MKSSSEKNSLKKNSLKKKSLKKKSLKKDHTKTLPKLGDKVHIRKYGYKITKPDNERRNSLKKASKKHGTLTVLKRLNLIRNLSRNKKAEEVLSKDVQFMSDMYKQVKAKGKIPKRVVSKRKVPRKK